MKNIIRFFYQLLIIASLKRKNVRISLLSSFNKSTSFEGYNVILRKVILSGTQIGKGTYIGMNSRLINCNIGRFCSIAADVSIIIGDHPTHFVSTSPSFFSLRKQNGLLYTEKQLYEEILPKTIIGNDVWIGEGAKIMGGVKIGNGAVIGAGALVTKDVPSYAIVIGIPAKVIKYRFEQDIIKKIENSEWWNKSDKWLKENVYRFCNINNFLESIDK